MHVPAVPPALVLAAVERSARLWPPSSHHRHCQPRLCTPSTSQSSRRRRRTTSSCGARGALTAAECAGWIAFCEGLGPVSTRPRGGRPESGNAYRDNYRVQVHEIEIAEALWSSGLGDAIAAVLPAHNEMVPSGFNDNIRMYRYDPGLRFGKH